MRRACLLAAVGWAACAPAASPPQREPAAQATTATATGATDDTASELDMTKQQSVCKNTNEIERAIGTVCTVVGTLEEREFRNPKGVVFRVWPVVVMEDGRDVLVESLWHEDEKPGAETIARLRGQRVAVTGMLHGEPPGSISNIAVPTISPVDDIGPASE